MMKEDLACSRGGAYSPRPMTGNSKSNKFSRKLNNDMHGNAIIVRGSSSDLKQMAARSNRRVQSANWISRDLH